MNQIRIGDVAKVGSSKRIFAKEYSEAGIPFLRSKEIGDLSRGEAIKTELFISRSRYNIIKEKYGIPKPGDLLLTSVGSIGNTWIVDNRDFYFKDGNITHLQPSSKLDSQYLMYFFKCDSFKNQLSSNSTGTAYSALTINRINDLNIPFPSLKTQQKIAAILDEADKLRQLDKKLIKKYEDLSQSLFLEMFGDPIINPKSWQTVKFSKVGKLDRGKSKHRPRNAPELLGGPYPLIQTGDVANSQGYIKEFKKTYSELGLAQSKIWPKGTLCITIAANIAKTGILTFDACFPDSVVGFVPNNETVNEYVQSWISFLQKIIEEKAPAVAQKNINLSILRDIEFMKPPKSLQLRFSANVREIELQKSQANQSLMQSENLFNSLLQKAFNGELV